MRKIITWTIIILLIAGFTLLFQVVNDKIVNHFVEFKMREVKIKMLNEEIQELKDAVAILEAKNMQNEAIIRGLKMELEKRNRKRFELNKDLPSEIPPIPNIE